MAAEQLLCIGLRRIDMNDLLLELAAMAKRFSEIYEDSDFGLCAIRHGIDGPYVQLTEDAFKREFHSYSVREREEDEYRNLYAYQNGVMFITLERKSKEVP